MPRVFVTGATGNIGRETVRLLTEEGHDVTAMVRRRTKIPGCKAVVADLADVGVVERAVRGADHIVHLASPRADLREVVVVADVLGTGRLLEMWQNGNFVYVSSSTIYGIPGTAPLTESHPMDVLSWYDLGKVTNEYQLRLTPIVGSRRAWVSLRPALVFTYGPRRRDRQFLDYIYLACKEGREFVFDSDEMLETAGCAFIGVDEMARAVVEAMSIEEPGAFNVAGGFCTWVELIETFNRLAGTQATVSVSPDGEDDESIRLPQSRTELDTSAFEAATGFYPRSDLEALVESFLEAERNEGNSDSEAVR